MQEKIIKQRKRHAVSQMFHAKDDKDKIATWRQDLDRVLHIFNVRSLGGVWRSLTGSRSDGVVDKQPLDPFGYSSQCLGGPEKHQRSN